MTDTRIVIGLMSGTSTDGIDAGAMRFRDGGARPSVELLAFITVGYADEVRATLHDLARGEGGAGPLARASFLLGEIFASAAREVMDAAALTREDVAVIGSGGHTVAHLPAEGGSLQPPATMQIGEAAVIAERTGIPVVSDFRVRDVAAGGQGAPLVPHFDFQFLRSDTIHRAVLNIGGIANVTVLRAGCSRDDVVAFDTGPGNMPIDIAVRALFPERPPFDRDGEIARAGSVDDRLLGELLGHRYLSESAPKSCGREEFGEVFVSEARRRAPATKPEDLVATLTAFSGRAVGDAIAGLRRADDEAWEVIISGGGAHNPTLVEAIAQRAHMTIRRSDDFGIPVDAKEAMAFGYLALETLRGESANVPSATGARGPRVLGKITPA